MTAAFWWYLLAGFIVGFCLSTVWEWLYFRQRRMRITDRRIAELEQALRSRERDIAVVEVLPEPALTWSATEYQSPGVLLENEGDAESAQRMVAPVAAATAYAATAYAATTTVRNGNGQPGDGKANAAPWDATHPDAAVVQAVEGNTEDESAGALAKAALAATAVAATAVAAALRPEDETTSAAPAVAAAAADAELAGEEDAEVTAAALAAAALAATAAAQGADKSAPDPDMQQEEAPPLHDDTPPQATTEVRGFSARQGYIVSELSPSEFATLQATQKARQAARKAWEQARAVTDYLRNV